MQKRTHLTLEAALLTALLALLGLSLFGNPTTVTEEVMITGRLHMDDDSAEDVVLVVEVNGERCLHAEVFSNGRFTISVPLGAKANLQFFKPGHLPKAVLVDTRNALNTRKAQRVNRKVKFDVVLEPERNRPGRGYTEPVGSIGFVNGTGTMKVRHHEQYAPVSHTTATKPE